MKILQVGMGKFLERLGGLNRYYYECTNDFSHADIQFDGLTAIKENVYSDSLGEIILFEPLDSSLLKCWKGVIKKFTANFTT